MAGLNKFALVIGAAVLASGLLGAVLGQEIQQQTIVAPDGKTITVAAPPGHGPPPEVMERMMRERGRGPRPGSDPFKPGEGPPGGEQKGPGDEKKEGNPGEKEKPGGEGKKPDEKSQTGPEPLKRESAPAEKADPRELDVRPDERGLVQFNFVGQKWLDVLEWLARISAMSLDWQELPGDYLNLTTQRPYTVREARDLINSHLLARGYTILIRGEVMSVAKIDKLDPGLVPRVAPEALSEHDPYEYVKVSFPLKWLLAEQAVEELKPMLSPNGKLTALKTTNRLEAMDAVTNLRDVNRVLAEEQSGTGQEQLVREFQLQYTLAEDVQKQLEALLGIDSKRSGPPMPMSPDQMRAQQEAMRQAMEQAQQQQGGKGGPPSKAKPEVYLVANKRKNSILANAPPDKMAIIEQAIKAIDMPAEQAHSLLRNMERMQVYRLESMEPGPLIKTLQDLGELDFNTRLEADNEHNAIIAYASLADHITIRSLVDKLDGGGRRAEVIQLEGLRAETVVKVVDFMMGGGRQEEDSSSRRSRGDFYPPWFSPYSSYSSYRGSSSRRSDQYEDRFRVDADVKNNALLLWCNDRELAKVQDLIKRLQENQRQGLDAYTVEVYRLVTLDPEPFVKTLQDMDALSFQARLEVDQENNSVVAYGSQEDHAKVRELIEQLDGSGRQFHVVPLRRLEADYVAGTIAFMMAGKEDTQQSGYSRTYVYNEYYGGGPSRDRGKEKKPDEFRVDADIEYNRLLLWANDVEMKEVENLLVKLGEIPPQGGNSSTIRVLEALPGPEQEQLLDRIRRIWPSLAPNPLVTPPPEPASSEQKIDEKAGQKAGQKQESDQGATPEATQPQSRPSAAAAAVVPVFRFATLPPQNGAQAQPAPLQGTPAPAASPAPAAPQAAPPGAAEPSQPPPRQAAPPAQPPPVSITQAPDGRLIITSEDTAALDKLEELIGRLAPPRKDYEVFRLRYAEAYWVAWNLEDFFKEEEKKTSSRDYYDSWYWGYPPSSGGGTDGGRRLSKRRPLKFISDDSTNTILVQGATPEQLRTITELIELYDQPPSTDSDSTRRTEVFPIRYSKADVVAEAVKDVYRDLLSDRDKSLANRGPQQQRPQSLYTYNFGGGEGDERKMPRWKGYLSIGIDELSNTLIVSAPEFLFRDIERLVKELDEAAKPTDAVHVVDLGRSVSASTVQKTLSKVLSEAAGGRKPSAPEAPRTSEGGRRRSGSPGFQPFD